MSNIETVDDVTYLWGWVNLSRNCVSLFMLCHPSALFKYSLKAYIIQSSLPLKNAINSKVVDF